MNILYVNSLEANNKELRQQLAAAIAACKLKDEVLAAWGNLTTTEWLREVAKVLAVQPDDSALKAWLGGPVAWMFSDNYGTHYTDDKREWYDGVGIESVIPLYSPKGLK